MHVVIVGCGRVGSGLARIIEDQGHRVAVVDKNPEAFSRLDEGFAGQQVVGVGFDRDTLEEAGIREAGAIAAVTSGDNSNILTARVARETFGIDRVVARIYDPRRAVIYERLGIPTIATVQWTIDRVVRKLVPDPSSDDWTDPTAQVMMVERPVLGESFQGSLAEIPAFAVLQILEMGRKTGCLHTECDDGPGRIWLSDGAPTHAETKLQRGFDAAIAVVPGDDRLRCCPGRHGSRGGTGGARQRRGERRRRRPDQRLRHRDDLVTLGRRHHRHRRLGLFRDC